MTSTDKPPKPEGEPKSPDFSGTKVLVVDDNVTMRVVIGKLLSKFGVNPKLIEDGASALEATRKERFDLIFMDCMMPDMDGYETTRLIREERGGNLNSGTTIVALTANATEEDVEKCVAEGMNDHLAKPFKPAELKAALNKWLLGNGADEEEKSVHETSSPVQEASLFDLKRLEEMFGQSPDNLQPLAALFLETLSEEREKIRALDSNDLDLKLLRLYCHTIKGASGNYGAGVLELFAAKAEDAAEQGDVRLAKSLLPELDELIEQTMELVGKMTEL